MNQLKRGEYPNDPALDARIKAYELAFRMQTSIPEVLGFQSETAATQEMYGLNEPETKDFGSKMLATRRLIERGMIKPCRGLRHILIPKTELGRFLAQ